MGRVTRLALAAVVCALLVVACGAGDSPSQDGAPGQDISLAWAGPLTGPSAEYGLQSSKAAELAVREINENGGIDGRDLVLETYDDRCEPTDAANVAARIASDSSVVGVVGHVCSSATLAALPIYERAGLTVVSGSSTSPRITEDGGYPNFSRTVPNDAQQGIDAALLAGELLGAKRLAVLYASDDYGQGVLENFLATVPDTGAEVVAQETYTPTQTRDFSAQLTAIKSADADALLLIGYYDDLGTAVTQLTAAGLEDVTIICSAGLAQAPFAELASVEIPGSYMLGYYDSARDTPENRAFADAFTQAYDDAPTLDAVYAYEAVFVYAQALEDGATAENMSEMVRAVTLDVATGRIEFDDSGNNSAARGVIQTIEDGAFVLHEEYTNQLADA